MFFKVVELLLRLFYYKRFRAADKIGKAAQLLPKGRPQEALTILEHLRGSLHPMLLPLYCFTLGRTLTSLERFDEAEDAFLEGTKSDPKSARAEVEIALLRAQKGDHPSCRSWLSQAIEKNDEVHSSRASAFLHQLSRIEDGSLLTEFEKRGETMAAMPLPGGAGCPGMPPDRQLLSQWAKQNPEQATALFDEIALLLALSRIRQGGVWVVRLAIEDTRVTLPDGGAYDPFEDAASLLLPSCR